MSIIQQLLPSHGDKKHMQRFFLSAHKCFIPALLSALPALFCLEKTPCVHGPLLCRVTKTCQVRQMLNYHKALWHNLKLKSKWQCHKKQLWAVVCCRRISNEHRDLGYKYIQECRATKSVVNYFGEINNSCLNRRGPLTISHKEAAWQSLSALKTEL